MTSFDEIVTLVDESLRGQFQQRIAAFMELYTADRHFDGQELVEQLCVEIGEAAATALRSNELVKTSLHKAREAKLLADDVLDHSTWTPTSVDKNGHGTYYRQEEGKTSHSFKVVGLVDACFLHMASVLLEFDLYTEWFPFCIEATPQGVISRFHRAGKFAIWMMTPIANREVFLVGYAVDDLTKNKRVVINSRSVRDDETLPDCVIRPNVTKGSVRADMSMGGFVIDVLTPTTCLVSFIMNVDPKIAHVPVMILNWISKKIIWVLLHQMGKAARDSTKPKSKYLERRKMSPEVYEYFEKRAMELFRLHWPNETMPVLEYA
jgi:hypothetical protein